MTDMEQRARELLAAELESAGWPRGYTTALYDPASVLSGDFSWITIALRAIVAALGEGGDLFAENANKSGEQIKRRIAAARMVLGMSTLQTRFADRDGEWSLSALFNQIEAAIAARTPSPSGQGVEGDEQIISAWAFAYNIDGAARNDLFRRLREQPALSPPRPAHDG